MRKRIPMNTYQTPSNLANIKLHTEHITSQYEDLKVIEKLSIDLREGEFVSILGPSGCGKSTLFHIIAGLLAPDFGDVFIDGQVVTGETNHVSYMYQKDLLLPWKKIIDNVAIPYVIKGDSKKISREKVASYFETFGLTGFENFYPHQLSGGMKQRAAMMRTYMNDHAIMLLDEPFGRLDAITKLKMQQWLKEVTKVLNRSILFITHDIEEALYLSHRIYVLSDRPAQVIEEITVDLNQEDFLSCTTSSRFNELKGHILELLNT